MAVTVAVVLTRMCERKYTFKCTHAEPSHNKTQHNSPCTALCSLPSAQAQQGQSQQHTATYTHSLIMPAAAWKWLICQCRKLLSGGPPHTPQLRQQLRLLTDLHPRIVTLAGVSHTTTAQPTLSRNISFPGRSKSGKRAAIMDSCLSSPMMLSNSRTTSSL